MLADLFLQFIEHERMITNLPQLHDRVHQRFRVTALAVLETISTVSRKKRQDSLHYFIFSQENTAGLHVRVHHSLQCRHVTFDDVFDLNKQIDLSPH